ncbi:MAG: helix-turn-helix transcriptional regulator [Cyanobacteria bacterium P01_F01_bin.3]
MPPYPCCLTLKTAIATHEMTGNELARILQKRFNRRRASNAVINGYFVQGMITGDQYAPDTLRGQIASIFEQTVKSLFPEYLIECATLQCIRQEKKLSQPELAEMINKRALRTLRSADISAYECGHRYCHPDTRQAIAGVLKMDEAIIFPEYQAFVLQ